MNKTELAKALNGLEYRNELTPALEQEAKENELAIIFGASDDLIEVRGWANDEVDAYEGGCVYFTQEGLLERQCDDDDCPHEIRRKEAAIPVVAVWGDGEASWTYETEIDHATFDIMENGELYCRGIVFGKDDVEALIRRNGK